MATALGKVKRDPEYCALDYLTVINDKLSALPYQYEHENETKKEACWSVFNKCEKVFAQLLQVR